MLTGSEDSLTWLISGAGETGRAGDSRSARFGCSLLGKAAPQISQLLKEG